MKICFLTHNLKQDNGAGVFSLRLIDGLKDFFNCEIVVLTSQASGFLYEKPILYPKKIKLVQQFLKIRKIIKKCDVIHALDAFPYGMVAVLSSLGLGKKIIITAVGSGSIIPLHKIFYSQLLRYCYRKASRIIAISRFTKQEILNKIDSLSIQVINHGVDFKDFSKIKNQEKSELLKYHPYILSVGTLRWRKGYHLSIQSFALINKIFPDLKYLIVGKRQKEDYFDRLKKLIGDLDLEDKVLILDNIDNKEQLYKIYQNAELFCLASQNVSHDVEGFGLVFLEAAAAGLPVVGSKDCGVEDAVLSGQNGFLVNSKDINEFAGAITRILKDRPLKEKMMKSSLRLAQSSTWESKILAYHRIYQELLVNLEKKRNLE